MSEIKSVALKFVGVAAAFHALKSKRALSWSAFLTLHPLIKNLLKQISTDHSATLSNIVSSVLLYVASKDSVLPKDYVSLYVWLGFFLIKAKQKISQIKQNESQRSKGSQSFVSKVIRKYESLPVTSATFSKVAFLAIFAQLLSHYLANPKSLNNLYINDTVRNRFFNPVWINYAAKGSSHHLDWKKVLATYAKTNALLIAVFGAVSFKLFKEKWDQKKYGVYLSVTERFTYKQILINWWNYSSAKGNSIANLIVVPNLISIILLSLTSSPGSIRSVSKFSVGYNKLIGFILALIAVSINSEIDPKIFGAINLYLFRLILLSKWRIIKTQRLALPNWNTIETLVMSFGVFQIMKLKDKGVNDSIVNIIGKIM